MIWLVVQLWPWLALSAALGAASTAALRVRRVPVERWVEVPRKSTDVPWDGSGALDVVDVVAAATALGRPGAAPGQSAARGLVTAPVDGSLEAPAPVIVDGWPFPLLPGRDASYRPWEAEELWSRPVQNAVPGVERAPSDTWTEAASSWRSWAEEAVSRAESARGSGVDDDDLFAADREAERLGLDAGVFSTSLGHLRGGLDRSTDRESPADLIVEPVEEDAFPYAEPVEAPGLDNLDNVEPFPQVVPIRRISA